MAILKLSTEVLEWAAENIGESLESMSESFAANKEKREAFLKGNLTHTQAEKFANKVRIPYGYLFLSKPPKEIYLSIPDLRQTPNPEPLSQDFFEVLEDADRKQQWYKDYLKRIGASELPFVGKFSVSRSNIKDIVQDITKTLSLTSKDVKSCATSDAYFTLLSKRVEDAGILVLKSGIVRSNTKRALSYKEFKGFALCDPIAPLVFINGKDFEVSWVFTLMHEVSHIWLGQSGVSDLALKPNNGHIEKICNAVAAEILVPEKEFLSAYSKNEDISGLARIFRVSRLVVARRALELKYISKPQYDVIADQSANAKPKLNNSGGNAYATLPVRNSQKLTDALVTSTMGGHTLFRVAARLLNVKPDTVSSLAKNRKKKGEK